MGVKKKSNVADSLFASAKLATASENGQDGFDKSSSIFSQIPENLGNIVEIDLDLIDEFPDHPFRVIDDASMERLKNDIAEHGLHTPILVKRSASKPGRYVTLAGHRREYASRALGKKKIKAIIMDVTEDEAVRIMVTSNLDTRDEILPSEKAFAYKMLRDAEDGSDIEAKTAAEVGLQTNESRDTVNRYIRLTYLTKQLLDMVDANVFGYAAGSDISFLSETHQIDVAYYITKGCKLDGKKAKVLKDTSKNGKLTEKVIEKIMIGAKAGTKASSFTLKSEKLKAIIPKTIKKNMQEDYLLKSVKQYQLVEGMLNNKSESEKEEILVKAISAYLNNKN